MNIFRRQANLGEVVHVIPVELDCDEDCVSAALKCLSEDECARAEGLLERDAQRRFMVGRAVLRNLVGLKIGMPPGDIRFQYGRNGKPRLWQDSDLEFNVSASGHVAVFAFAHRNELGIDIERIRPIPRALGIARRFTPGEHERLSGTPAAELDRAFLTCWVRKEACVKAIGGDIEAHLSSLAVPEGELQHGQDVRTGDCEFVVLHELALGPSVIGALATRNPVCRIDIAAPARIADLLRSPTSVRP
jgi:4'-phosphopantetheinyl transferase